MKFGTILRYIGGSHQHLLWSHNYLLLDHGSPTVIKNERESMEQLKLFFLSGLKRAMNLTYDVHTF